MKRYTSYGGMVDCETGERSDMDCVFVPESEVERMVREAVHRAMLAGWSRSDGPISREYVERIVRKVMRDEE